MLKYHTVPLKVCILINAQIILMKKLAVFDMERLTTLVEYYILYICAAMWYCVNVYN